jgi:peptidyl-prolyl cis-trans isomerase C
MVPQVRMSSHILFKCSRGEGCERAELRPKVEKVIAELRAGADFTEMVHKYSQDPGTKAKDGKFDLWVKMDTPGVSPRYVRGLFKIAEIGGYSDMVETQFGIHILRLDGIKESEFLPYEDVKDQVIKSLEKEYRTLSVKAFNQSFQISEKAFIDGKAMDELFNQYKSAE